MSRQRSPRAGYVVLDLRVFDSQPADDTRLARPAPYPYWTGFYNPGRQPEMQRPTSLMRGSCTQERPPGRPYCLSSEGGAQA